MFNSASSLSRGFISNNKLYNRPQTYSTLLNKGMNNRSVFNSFKTTFSTAIKNKSRGTDTFR